MNWKKYNIGIVPEQEVLFQVELSLDTALGEISAGFFVFEQGVTLKASKKDWKKNKKEYQERANRLMTRHYEFYQSICDEEYVTSGSVLTCSNGDELITIELPEDHGIIAENGKPLLTCKDCEAGTHIGSFGTCTCNPENYTRLGHHPSELSDDEKADGRGKYKCFPILSHDWITKNQDFMIYVGNIEADFHAALEKGAVLICQYGGLITIAEVPDKSEDKELSDNLSEGITEEAEEEIYISWLKCYKGQPDDHAGVIVTHDKEAREEMKKTYPGIDWYSFENRTEKNQYTEPYLQGLDFIPENGILMAPDSRYWITLGPKVFYSDYSDDGPCQADEFKDYIGCLVDVILKHMDTGEYVYFQCRWSGNIKEHTYNNGIFQTGKPYPEAYWGKKTYKNGVTVDTYVPPDDFANGSIVEFTGKDPGNNKALSKYVVEYLVVYQTFG